MHDPHYSSDYQPTTIVWSVILRRTLTRSSPLYLSRTTLIFFHSHQRFLLRLWYTLLLARRSRILPPGDQADHACSSVMFRFSQLVPWVVLGLFASASAQCVYTETECQCAIRSVGSLCLRPIPGTTGQCQSYVCGAGHVCDCMLTVSKHLLFPFYILRIPTDLRSSDTDPASFLIFFMITRHSLQVLGPTSVTSAPVRVTQLRTNRWILSCRPRMKS